MIIFISHIGVHLVLLISTGIVTTVIYCQIDSDKNDRGGSTKVSVLKTNMNKMYFDGRRHLTSQSFHYEGFHEQQQIIQQANRGLNASRDNLDPVQERKLPTLPNSNFQLVHTSKLDPASFRSAPNLNRLHSAVNPYASPLNGPDESTSGESGEHTEKSPLIKLRPESTINQNYSRRKLCASLTEEEILRPDNGDLSRSPQRARKSPIRSLHEADAFVSSLSNVKPPRVPPRPHERQKSTGSSFNVSFNLDHERKDDDIYEPTNKQLCTTRLITVPEPSEADEDSMGYTKIKEETELKISKTKYVMFKK